MRRSASLKSEILPADCDALLHEMQCCPARVERWIADVTASAHSMPPRAGDTRMSHGGTSPWIARTTRRIARTYYRSTPAYHCPASTGTRSASMGIRSKDRLAFSVHRAGFDEKLRADHGRRCGRVADIRSWGVQTCGRNAKISPCAAKRDCSRT